VRKLVLAAAALLLAAALVASCWEGWLLAALTPRGRFDARAVPRAPDYADLAAWTAHPERRDAADVTPVGEAAVDPARAPADVFYVHPTSYLGSGWNGPVDDAALNVQTDELATLIQASAFNGCCAVYGPRYRQAQAYAFLRESADSAAAIELAYQDVRAAFLFFVAQHGRGRPFILAGHSQGSVLAARLLEGEIAGSALRERLVAAYLIGAPVAPGAVPACAAPDDTGCIVTWNARGPRFSGSVFDFHSAGERLCVNPLTWRADEAHAAAALNQGAVFLHAGDGRVLPGFADAQCRGGMLIVRAIGAAPRDFASRVLDFAMGPENYHPIEYQLYYMNLRRNAERRVAAFLRGRVAAR
jgi:hypothetical protein